MKHADPQVLTIPLARAQARARVWALAGLIADAITRPRALAVPG